MITTNCRKFLKTWEYQTTWPASWEFCMPVKKQRLELDMERQAGSKLEKEYDKAVYCHPAYLTYMQSTSWETLGWRKHKLKSWLLGEIAITQICRWHHPYGRKWRGTKKPLDESERGEWKHWLKTQHSKYKDHGIQSHQFSSIQLLSCVWLFVTPWIVACQFHPFKANRWETTETVTDLIFLGSKITADSDCIYEIRIRLLLGRKAMTNLDNILKSRDAGVQPQQDPGEPSGWTALARERHVGPAFIGPSLRGRERERERKKETRPGMCSRVWQLLYFWP